MSPTSFHERRKAERMRDPEFRAEYERARGEIEQIDSLGNDRLEPLSAPAVICDPPLALRLNVIGATVQHRRERTA